MDLKFDFKPLPWQQRVMADSSQFMCITAGRATGKSHAVIAKMLLFALQLYQARKTSDYPRQGQLVRILYAAPTRENMVDAIKLFNDLLPDFFKNGKNMWRRDSSQRCEVMLFDKYRGIHIRFLSAFNKSSFRSSGLDLMILDEAGYIGGATQTKTALTSRFQLESFIIEVCMGLLIRPHTHGRLWLASTPAYATSSYDKIVTKIINKSDEFWSKFSYHHANYTDNHILTSDQVQMIEDIGELYPLKFRVEYLAEVGVIWSPESGDRRRVFEDDVLNKCFVSWTDHVNEYCSEQGNKYTYTRAPYYAISLDIAYSGRDSAIFAVFDIANNLVVRLEKHNGNDLVKLAGELNRLKRVYNVAASNIIVDTTGHARNFHTLVTYGDKIRKFIFRKESKGALYSNLCSKLGCGLITLPDEHFNLTWLPQCPLGTDQEQDQRSLFALARRQMQTFLCEDYTELTGGISRQFTRYKEGGEGDDICDALAMLSQVGKAITAGQRAPNVDEEDKKAAPRRKISGSMF